MISEHDEILLKAAIKMAEKKGLTSLAERLKMILEARKNELPN